MSAQHLRSRFARWLVGGVLGAAVLVALSGCGSSNKEGVAQADDPPKQKPSHQDQDQGSSLLWPTKDEVKPAAPAVADTPKNTPETPAKAGPHTVTVRGKIILAGTAGAPLKDWKVDQVQFGATLAKLDGNSYQIDVVPDEWPVNIFVKDAAGNSQVINGNCKVRDIEGQEWTFTCNVADAMPVPAKEDPTKPVTVRGKILAAGNAAQAAKWKLDQVLFGKLPATLDGDGFEITLPPGEYQFAVRFKNPAGITQTWQRNYHVEPQQGQELTIKIELPPA